MPAATAAVKQTVLVIMDIVFLPFGVVVQLIF